MAGEITVDLNVVGGPMMELGCRALALVLKHEWPAALSDGTIDVHVCPECDGCEPSVRARMLGYALGHRRTCAWGAIVAEVRKMRDTT